MTCSASHGVELDDTITRAVYPVQSVMTILRALADLHGAIVTVDEWLGLDLVRRTNLENIPAGPERRPNRKRAAVSAARLSLVSSPTAPLLSGVASGAWWRTSTRETARLLSSTQVSPSETF